MRDYENRSSESRRLVQQTGLPPTPIGNPGLSSLDAALDPEDTDYFYFILDRQAGYHRFSKTLAEHEKLERELGYR